MLLAQGATHVYTQYKVSVRKVTVYGAVKTNESTAVILFNMYQVPGGILNLVHEQLNL